MYYHVNFLYSYFHLPNSFRLTWVICTFISNRRGPHSFEWNTLCIPEPTTVYPKKYAHGFSFAVFCCGYTLTDFPISIRLTSLALWQSNDCPSASKATLMNMDKYFMWIHYERLQNHNKAKHNKTVSIFLGIYCSSHYIQHLHLKAEHLHTKSCKPQFTRITYTPDQDIETQTKWSHFLRRHFQLNFVYDYRILIPISLKLGSSGSISNKPTFHHLSQWWSSLLPHIYVSLGLDELKTACIIDKTWIITSHLSFKSLYIRDKSDNPVWPSCRWHQGDHAPK